MGSAANAMPLEHVDEIAIRLLSAYDREATIFTCGNGGSASLASHFACDLAKGTSLSLKQRRLRVIALTDNLALITAWSNDSSYEQVFSEQLKNLAQPGDLLIVISGSGNSPNVLAAIEMAREIGCEIIGMVGGNGGKMAAMCDHCLVVPSENMQIIEDLHVSSAHCVFSIVRTAIKELAAPQVMAATAGSVTGDCDPGTLVSAPSLSPV